MSFVGIEKVLDYIELLWLRKVYDNLCGWEGCFDGIVGRIQQACHLVGMAVQDFLLDGRCPSSLRCQSEPNQV